MVSLGKKVLVALSYLAVIAVNFLANALPINGISTGDVSEKYANLFAPAGITFSIWGLIYLLLLGYVLFYTGLLRKRASSVAERVSTLFIISSFANVAWIFAWHYDLIGLSVVIMFVLLSSLIRTATTLKDSRRSIAERWFVKIPFSVYFGWITVATIANITVFLVSVDWNGLGLSDSFWTIIILVVGAIIGLWRSWYDKDVAYLLVFVWAYGGILFKHLSSSGFAGVFSGIIATLIVCIGVFLFMASYLCYVLCYRHRDFSKIERS